MKKRIDTTRELRQRAMKLFGVTERTVFNAIAFDSDRGDTDRAKRIRSYLLQNGGRVLVELPEVETIHDGEGKMTQTFPNGAAIVVDKNSGDAAICFNGERLVGFENVFIWQLELLQVVASKLKPSDVGQFAEPSFVERWKLGITEVWRDKYVKNEKQRAKSKEFSYPRIKK